MSLSCDSIILKPLLVTHRTSRWTADVFDSRTLVWFLKSHGAAGSLMKDDLEAASRGRSAALLEKILKIASDHLERSLYLW